MIRILSDSSTLYSINEGQAKNIGISPLVVTINNKSYLENEEINSKEFVKLINDIFLNLHNLLLAMF